MFATLLFILAYAIFAPTNFTCYDDPDCFRCLPDTMDQEMCGSCHAFAASFSFHHRLCRKANITDAPSAQHFISCLPIITCQTGGYIEDDLALGEYIGFVPLQCQSYLSFDGTIPSCSIKVCDDSSVSQKVYYVKKGTIRAYNITSMPNSENAIIEEMKNEIYTKGAIPVTINADDLPKNQIDETPLENLNSDEINHAVSIIGYEYIGSDLYWIIVNSWGNNVGYTKGTHGGLYKIKHKSARLGEFFVVFDIDI